MLSLNQCLLTEFLIPTNINIPRQPPRPRAPPAPLAPAAPLPQPAPLPEPALLPQPAPPPALPTPVPINTNTTLKSTGGANNLLLRIKLDLYTGDGDVAPWMAKVKTLITINNIADDPAKIAYVHLHLAGKASSWFNDKGFAYFKTFEELEKALLKEYGVSDGQRQRYRGEILIMEQGDQSVQVITERFEIVWRSAYPIDTSTDSPYKMHNYLRILQPRIASAVGLQSPHNYDAAKDLALKVEAIRGSLVAWNIYNSLRERCEHMTCCSITV